MLKTASIFVLSLVTSISFAADFNSLAMKYETASTINTVDEVVGNYCIKDFVNSDNSQLNFNSCSVVKIEASDDLALFFDVDDIGRPQYDYKQRGYRKIEVTADGKISFVNSWLTKSKPFVLTADGLKFEDAHLQASNYIAVQNCRVMDSQIICQLEARNKIVRYTTLVKASDSELDSATEQASQSQVDEPGSNTQEAVKKESKQDKKEKKCGFFKKLFGKC